MKASKNGLAERAVRFQAHDGEDGTLIIDNEVYGTPGTKRKIHSVQEIDAYEDVIIEPENENERNVMPGQPMLTKENTVRTSCTARMPTMDPYEDVLFE